VVEVLVEVLAVSFSARFSARMYWCTKSKIYTNLLGANMVRKSGSEEEINGKDGKYCICIPVYMGL